MRVINHPACKTVLIGLLLLFYYNSASGIMPETVRVRVLEKYKPKIIILHHIKNAAVNLTLDKNSILPLTINSSREYQITIANVKVNRNYTGSLYIDREGEVLRIINTVPLETYVQSVVLSEMGVQHPEAMRSQAVLARTWAVKHLHPAKDYDFNDLTDSQVYKGIFNDVSMNVDWLLPAYGQVLTYNNKLIDVFYHADCANRSYSAYEIWGFHQYPYYQRIIFPPELQTRPIRKWQRKISKREIDKIFHQVTDSAPPLHYKKSTRRGQIGIDINRHWVNIDHFRIQINRKLGWNQLRSNHFTLQEKHGYLIFTGTGFGHLVGLCQKSAVELAKHGWTYSDILRLFYPGTTLTRPDGIVQTQ